MQILAIGIWHVGNLDSLLKKKTRLYDFVPIRYDHSCISYKPYVTFLQCLLDKQQVARIFISQVNLN